MIQAMRLLIVSGISVGLVACHSNPNTTTTATPVVVKVDSPKVTQADTAGLAAFRAEKKARYEDSLKNVGVMRERSRKQASYAASRPRSSYASSGTRSSYAASGYASPVEKKKSHAARNGALIGAGAGAITGAIVAKKKKGVGALIGGVAGGAAGYGVGKIIQNKKENQ